jgi:hypothetical protein
LEESILSLEQRGIDVLLTGMQDQPESMLRKVVIIPDLIAENHIFARFDDAIAYLMAHKEKELKQDDANYMITIITIIFVIGYGAIALEHPLKINKAATALITGVLCWSVYALFSADKHLPVESLTEHLGEVAGILFS